MKIIYEANDGTVFDKESDCWEYEVGIKFKDVDNNEIHMYDNAGVQCSKLEECYYIKVDTDRAREYVEFMSNETGLSVPEDFDIGVCYCYNEADDDWYSLDAEIKRLKEIEKIFRNNT